MKKLLRWLAQKHNEDIACQNKEYKKRLEEEKVVRGAKTKGGRHRQTDSGHGSTQLLQLMLHSKQLLPHHPLLQQVQLFKVLPPSPPLYLLIPPTPLTNTNTQNWAYYNSLTETYFLDHTNPAIAISMPQESYNLLFQLQTLNTYIPIENVQTLLSPPIVMMVLPHHHHHLFLPPLLLK